MPGTTSSESPISARPSALRNIGTRLSLRRRKKQQEKQEDGSCSVKYISRSEYLEIQKELDEEYHYSTGTICELHGMSCASVVTKLYPASAKLSILIICGKEQAGGVGLACARHLKFFGYSPTIYCTHRPSDPIYDILFRQSEALEIPRLSFLPNDPHLIAHSYSLVIESMFDISSGDEDMSEHDVSVIERLSGAAVPIVSIDIPAGWDPNEGPPSQGSKLPYLEPECLISLIAPKLCSSSYAGKHHYLAGRYIPQTLVERHTLNYPSFPHEADYVIDLMDADYPPAASQSHGEGQCDGAGTTIHGQE